jgi:hypothetical protein
MILQLALPLPEFWERVWRTSPRNPDKKTYYSVGWTAHGSSSGVFRQVSMRGGVLRVLDKCVHQAALENAGKKAGPDFPRPVKASAHRAWHPRQEHGNLMIFSAAATG